jgi:hypothetical protein
MPCACATAADHPRRRRTFNGRAVLGLVSLVSVLGVLAFIFSAVSPGDDDIQQEFALRSESGRSLVQHCKTIASTSITLVDPVHCGELVAGTLASFHYTVIQRLRMPGFKIRTMVFRTRVGDRSPPIRSSFISLIA